MHRKSKQLYLWCCMSSFWCLMLHGKLHAQNDANYWSLNYGTKGQILNGAVIAGVDDNTAVFYNPSAIGIDTTAGVSLSLLSPSYSVIRTNSPQFKDNPKITSFRFLPSMGSYQTSLFKDSRITTSFILMTRQSTSVEINNRFTVSIPGAQSRVFVGTHTYSNKISETCAGGGISYRVKENFSLGYSQFVSFKSHKQFVETERSISLESSPNTPLSLSRESLQFGLSSTFVFMGKLGASWRYRNINFGFTLQTPNFIELHKGGNYRLSRFEYANADTVTSIGNINRDVQGLIFKRPWIWGAGVVFIIKDIHKISVSSEYFTDIPEYEIIRDDAFLISGTPFTLTTKARTVANLAIGYERTFSPRYTMLAGFRTDFTSNPNPRNKAGYQVLNSSWNVYHASIGGHFRLNGFRFSAGLDLAFSNNADSRIFTPFSTIDTSSEAIPLGPVREKARYTAISLFFNYGFLFK